MISFGFRIQTIAFILFVALATYYCASKNYLVVNYQLPSEPVTVQETEISLIFKDQRTEQILVTQSAKSALKDFSGNFALIVASGNKNERLLGAFSLSSMMETIFRQRFENAGVRVAPQNESRPTAVEIILKEFKLDLIKRKWVVQVTYQANLLEEDRFKGGQTISGNAERLRVVGSKDAEMVIGELLTDAVNRLNLDELFDSSGS
ncbi:MAG: hypothetical protein JRF36_04615 [Deltaproteobacteria bacterium]|jgi:hypothetical protein|nr:hypothetical protein [Deltaproteobacteria bacterium]MBW2468585.1 hypothetical protein [Deltaproteobacteria bacterium]